LSTKIIIYKTIFKLHKETKTPSNKKPTVLRRKFQIT